MKRCPECNRDYYDDSLQFCLDDGSKLLDGPASRDEHVTAILPGNASTSEDATRVFEGEPRSAGGGRSRYILPIVVAAILLAATVGGYRYLSALGKKSIDSIAVMPFVNASGNPDLEYLSDGITESLINSLTRVPDLSVKARSSVFTYKGKEVSPQQVAKDLAVEAVLNGRVVQRGDEVTLNLELIEAATGNQLWGEQYKRKLADLTALQSEIARDVSAKLHTELTGAAEQQIARSHTQNAEAYQLYLKGKYHWNRRTREDILKGIEYFRQAADKDPNYALAYSGLAESFILLHAYAGSPPQVAYTAARTAGLRALELDPTVAEAQTALAVVSSDYDWNFAEAEQRFRRAIELNPNYATAHHWYAEFLVAMGRYPEALTEIQRAQDLDPLSLIINGLHGVMLRYNGRNDEALAQLLRTEQMDPNFSRTHIFLAELYQDMGRYEDAAGEFYRLAVLGGMPAVQLDAAREQVIQAYRKEGPKGYFRMMATFFEDGSKRNDTNNPPPITIVAACWLHAGEKERAYELLEEGLKRRDPEMLRIRNPIFNPIKDEPRYQQLVRQMGLPDISS